MPDIFLSYSSKDREVAERIQAGLTKEGYDVFWDQATPPGIDWDTWIRRQLKEARCVIVLWSQDSVSSPNVRHEAMIGRDTSKLLPVLVDALTPDDFPMGLFFVQALSVGRTKKSLAASWPKLLEEVRSRVDAAPEASEIAAPETKPARKRRVRPLWRRPAVVGGVLGALLLAIAIWQYRPLMILFDADRPPVPRAWVETARNGEALARARIVRSAEQTLTSNRTAVGTSWVWLAAQLMSGAPEEARGLAPQFFAYLARVQNAECGCFFSEDIPHAVGNAWVVIASSKYGQQLNPALVRTILEAQNPEGWWAISLSATRNGTNAGVHATAMLTIALVHARDAGIIPAESRAAVDTAIARAVTWLNRGPDDGAAWVDYPNNERRVEDVHFAAMAAVASALGGEANGRAAQAFRRAVQDFPPVTDSFTSASYVELPNGSDFIDQYRHPRAPWIGAAAVLTYRDGSVLERRTLRRIIRAWLASEVDDERLLRLDWMAAETLFLRALAFPRLQRQEE